MIGDHRNLNTDPEPKRLRGMPGKPRGKSETGFHRYNGTPIQNSDKAYYEGVGVKFFVGEGGDLMPDGVHLKPWRLRNDRKSDVVRYKAGLNTAKQPREMDELIVKLEAEYDELPAENRPRFSEWVTTQQDKLITGQLLRVIFASGNPQACIKSINTLWEFGKPKPKAQLEISQPEQQTMQINPQELLQLACEVNGIDPATLAIRKSN